MTLARWAVLDLGGVLVDGARLWRGVAIAGNQPGCMAAAREGLWLRAGRDPPCRRPRRQRRRAGAGLRRTAHPARMPGSRLEPA